MHRKWKYYREGKKEKKNLQKSQENTRARDFFNKVAGPGNF